MLGVAYLYVFGAHAYRALKRNTLRFCGIRPVRASFFGLIEQSAARRQQYLKTTKAPCAPWRSVHLALTIAKRRLNEVAPCAYGSSLSAPRQSVSVSRVREIPPIGECVPWIGAIAQLGERLNGIQEVRGSTPLGSTILGLVRHGLTPV